jgi:hypothetical protein
MVEANTMMAILGIGMAVPAHTDVAFLLVATGSRSRRSASSKEKVAGVRRRSASRSS